MTRSFSRKRILATLTFTIASAPLLAGTTTAQETMMKHTQTKPAMAKMAAMQDSTEAPIGLGGYCPVCVIALKKWEKGNPNITSNYDGVTYLFPSEPIRAKFDAAPEKYAPALNGDCIVCYEKFGKRVPGSVQHAALHDGRLYLFPSDKEKQVFLADANAYTNTDLALGGECVLCLAKFGKHVPGSPDHTVIHNGLRYQFPSENEAKAFAASPHQWVTSDAVVKESMMKSNAMKDRAVSSNSMHREAVRLVGRSGCAGCEFGVTPLSAPDELGLAVVADDGSVIVVEGAHKNYPKVYADRFESQRLAVEGMIVKTEGKVSWLKPTSLSVVQ